jgi:hypothetical protein
MSISEIIQLIISVSLLVGFIISFYKTFRDPDQKAETKIAVMEERCSLKHSTIDETISDIKQDITLIKQNHLYHIESDISDMKSNINKILTILNERDKKTFQ